MKKQYLHLCVIAALTVFSTTAMATEGLTATEKALQEAALAGSAPVVLGAVTTGQLTGSALNTTSNTAKQVQTAFNSQSSDAKNLMTLVNPIGVASIPLATGAIQGTNDLYKDASQGLTDLSRDVLQGAGDLVNDVVIKPLAGLADALGFGGKRRATYAAPVAYVSPESVGTSSSKMHRAQFRTMSDSNIDRSHLIRVAPNSCQNAYVAANFKGCNPQ